MQNNLKKSSFKRKKCKISILLRMQSYQIQVLNVSKDKNVLEMINLDEFFYAHSGDLIFYKPLIKEFDNTALAELE